MMIGDVIIKYDFIIDVSDRVEKTIGGKCLICFLQYGALWWRFPIWSRLFYYRRVCNSAEQKISQNIIQNYTKCR